MVKIRLGLSLCSFKFRDRGGDDLLFPASFYPLPGAGCWLDHLSGGRTVWGGKALQGTGNRDVGSASGLPAWFSHRSDRDLWRSLIALEGEHSQSTGEPDMSSKSLSVCFRRSSSTCFLCHEPFEGCYHQLMILLLRKS
jgi:hypothetical protein